MRVIVDTDLSLGAPGSEIDDGLALAMVVAEPGLDLQAVTTLSGNVDSARAASLTLDVLRRLGVEDVPVLTGAMSALCDPRPRSPRGPADAPHAGGVAGATGYAAPEIARRIVESPGEITVIALGPLTNVAVAISLALPAPSRRSLSWGARTSETPAGAPCPVSSTSGRIPKPLRSSSGAVLESGSWDLTSPRR